MKDRVEAYIYGEIQRSRRRSITLVSYRTLSIRSFDYPFGSISAIREALKLQYSSAVRGKDVDIFPAVLKKDGHRFKGAALVLLSKEMEKIEEGLDGGSKTTLWPLPFALVSELKGTGGAVCVLDDGVASAFFASGKPLVYRWQSLSRRTPEQERDWLMDYGKSLDQPSSKFVIVDVLKDKERLYSGVRDTLEAFPSFKNYSLSRKVLDGAIVAEHLSKSLFKLGAGLTAAGVIFASSGFVRASTAKRELSAIKARSVSVYKDAFGAGSVKDPLSQAKAILAGSKGRPDGFTLNMALGLLSKSWPEGAITLDSLRYSQEGSDITGTASEVSLVQDLRQALASSLQGSVRLGDIQQVPGGGLRFSMEMRWDR